MKIAISILFVLFCFTSCSRDNNTTTLVSSEEMKELMSLDSVQLIDVRTLEEFREGHLEGAQNIIYDDEFEQKIDQLDKTKPVAVYCRTGRRSEECSQILEKAGFKKIYNLKDGLSQWKYKGELIKDTLH